MYSIKTLFLHIIYAIYRGMDIYHRYIYGG